MKASHVQFNKTIGAHAVALYTHIIIIVSTQLGFPSSHYINLASIVSQNLRFRNTEHQIQLKQKGRRCSKGQKIWITRGSSVSGIFKVISTESLPAIAILCEKCITGTGFYLFFSWNFLWTCYIIQRVTFGTKLNS